MRVYSGLQLLAPAISEIGDQLVAEGTCFTIAAQPRKAARLGVEDVFVVRKGTVDFVQYGQGFSVLLLPV